MFTRNVRLMLASAAFVSMAAPAFALDGADVIGKLNAAYAGNGAKVEYDAVNVDGDTVTVTGAKIVTAVKAGAPDSAPYQPLPIGDVKMDGVKEDGKGGYVVDTVTLPDVNLANPKHTLKISDVEISELTIPGDTTGNTLDNFLFYKKASTGAMVVTEAGKEIASAESSSVTTQKRANNAGIDAQASVSNVKLDLANVGNPKTRDAVTKMGLTNVEGKIDMNANWEAATGKVNLQDLTFDFDNVGKLVVAYDMSGYTLDFAKAVQDAMKNAQASAKPEEAQQALGMSMLGLIQQLSLNAISIRFEDDSITKRALDYAASEQGTTAAELTQSLKAMAPLMLAQLNIPELQNQAATAINTYLDDPKSLLISATPAKPVPFPMIAGAAMGAPRTLPELLGLKIVAND
ncbi:hypothetical protein IFT84_00610 [Rhizobium sp. CFBP 8762]|uniref:hypothetical protein n=1 Tax=Rhizobium sp. CFBP 8762 TaxID=2775279 RepID=UPI00178097FD|nr:hypothetical protein [Rhizobium sp. CFBP 8762]MBD8553018.1 hypothetical protein [Rhizobium sp. CFBP 8762]